jgi:hypothetical protein
LTELHGLQFLVLSNHVCQVPFERIDHTSTKASSTDSSSQGSIAEHIAIGQQKFVWRSTGMKSADLFIQGEATQNLAVRIAAAKDVVYSIGDNAVHLVLKSQNRDGEILQFTQVSATPDGYMNVRPALFVDRQAEPYI